MIVGSGPAGLAAAIYGARGALSPLLVKGKNVGGQPNLATVIDDYPGFPDGISGPELIGLFQKQAARFDVKFIDGEVTAVNFKACPYEITIDNEKYLTKSVILAPGSTPLWLGLPSEQKLIGRGVSICATCDGPFFKDKKVAVVGGGDSALKEAYYLSKIAKEVTIIHRRDTLRGQEALQDQVQKSPNIKIIFNSTVEEVLGSEKVTGLKIKNVQTNVVQTLDIDGVFIAIGYKPDTGFLKGQIELDEKGFIVLKDRTKTSIAGVFAAGDAADPIYRQVVTATASGARAAIDAENYLDTLV